MTEEIQKLEGFTPGMFWTFLIVLVGLMSLALLCIKLYNEIKKIRNDKKDARKLEGQDITDRIADKVMEKLTPQLDEKFAEIDRKLAADKELLDMHTAELNATKGRVDRLDNDSKALLHGMSALLSHEATGNSIEKVRKVNDAMKNYLIDRKYCEEDWK